MVNIIEIKGESGPVRLLFSTYAVRRFSKLMNCAPTVEGIFPLFTGVSLLDAMVAMIQSGIEASCAEQKRPFQMTEFEVCNLLDGLTSETEGQEVTYAFMGSVLGRPASEMPALLQEWKDKTSELLQEAESEGNPVPLPVL